MIHDDLSNQIICQLKDSVFCNRCDIVKIVLTQSLESSILYIYFSFYLDDDNITLLSILTWLSASAKVLQKWSVDHLDDIILCLKLCFSYFFIDQHFSDFHNNIVQFFDMQFNLFKNIQDFSKLILITFMIQHSLVDEFSEIYLREKVYLTSQLIERWYCCHSRADTLLHYKNIDM